MCHSPPGLPGASALSCAAGGQRVWGSLSSLSSFYQEGLGNRKLHLTHLASEHEREGHQEGHQLPPEEEPGAAGPSAEGTMGALCDSAPGVVAVSSLLGLLPACHLGLFSCFSHPVPSLPDLPALRVPLQFAVSCQMLRGPCGMVHGHLCCLSRLAFLCWSDTLSCRAECLHPAGSTCF